MTHAAHDGYLEATTNSATPVELIAMLYHAGQHAVQEALRHLERGDIPARSREISKASEIIVELTMSLDIARGGDLCARLAGLYEYLLQQLVEANVRQSAEPLCEVARLLGTVGEAWEQLAHRQADCGSPDDTGAQRFPLTEEDITESQTLAWSF
jgi:flagellar protein FliS